MSEQTKVDMVSKMMAAYLHGVTDMQQIIKAIAEMKNLNPTIKSWVVDEHGELDLNMIQSKDLDKFKAQAAMAQLEYELLEGENGFNVIVTRGPMYEVNELGVYERDENGQRIVKHDELGREILGDRSILQEILNNIRHLQMQEEMGVRNVEDINNILDTDAAEAMFENKHTVLVGNMTFTQATLLQERADQIGIDTYLRYDLPDNKYSVEMLSNEFRRNTNFPDTMSRGERLMLDFTSAQSMPQVSRYMEHIDYIKKEIDNYIIDAKNGNLEDNIEDRYIVDINNPSRSILLRNNHALLANFGFAAEVNQFDMIELDLKNEEDLNGLNAVLNEIGYNNMEILSSYERDKYVMNFDRTNRSKNLYQYNQDLYKTSLQIAYDVDKELVEKEQLNIQIRNYTPEEKEQIGKTSETDDHLQMISERIPGSDIVIQDEVAKTVAAKYQGIDVLGFSEKFKTKFAELEVCEAMEHVPVSHYTYKDLTEFVIGTQINKEHALENPEQKYIMGTLEKNPAYVEQYDATAEPEIGYETIAGDLNFIDRNMDGIDDRLQGFLDYDGDHRDDRIEDEYDTDYVSVISPLAPGSGQEYEQDDYSTEWDSEIEPDHDLGDFWDA